MLEEGKEFISEIKEARIKRGLTIKQVSEITGVPYRSLQNWEAGVRTCPNYVTKMVVNMINHTDHQTFLEILRETLQIDAETAQSEEGKECIRNIIKVITRHLNK